MVFLRVIAVMVFSIIVALLILIGLRIAGIDFPLMGLLVGFSTTMGLQVLLADWVYDD